MIVLALTAAWIAVDLVVDLAALAVCALLIDCPHVLIFYVSLIHILK